MLRHLLSVLGIDLEYRIAMSSVMYTDVQRRGKWHRGKDVPGSGGSSSSPLAAFLEMQD